MATYKSTFSGAQMEDTFDKVQNKKITAADVGAVPTTRQVNGKPLSDDIYLTATDVGARSNTWMPSIGELSLQCVYRINSNADELLDFWAIGSGTNYPPSTAYPGGGFWYVNTVFYAGVSLTNNRRQIAYGYSAANGYMYERVYKDGTWTSWNRVYTAANITASTTAPTSALENDAQVQVYDA